MGALRWGILGTGGIARMFTRDLHTAGLTVQAVGSRRSDSAASFARELGAHTAHGSYADLCADDDVDIVYVATPHVTHHRDALMALEAGKHVLVEKPITINARQTQDIAEAAAHRGVLALEAMWTRWLPHMVRIRELIAAGELGDVRAFTADHTQSLPEDPGHRLNALELGGGALLDLGIYPISYSFELLGAPASIGATAAFKHTGADAQTATVFGYADGQVATTLCSSTAAGPNTASIVGTDGWIDIDPVWYTATGFRRYSGDGALVETFTSAIDGRGMQYQALEAERLVAAGRTESDVLPMSESVAIMRVMDEIRGLIGLRYPDE